VPDYIEELLATFSEHNPDREHIVFNEASAATFIADRYGPQELEAFRVLASPKTQADYFRLCAVHAVGGMWCDADSRCDAHLGQLFESTYGGELFQFETPGIEAVNNAFLVFHSPGHRLLGLMIDVATVNIQERATGFVAGPGVLSTLVMSQRLGSFDAMLAAPTDERLNTSDSWLERLRRMLSELTTSHLDLLRTTITEVRLKEALEDVRISPAARLHGLIAHHPWHLPYRDSDDHRPIDGNFFR